MNMQKSFVSPSHSRAPRSTQQLIDAVKAAGQDWEWYPTSEPMLTVIEADIQKHFIDPPTVLDCGAGDGRALMRLTKSTRYAIERSSVLLEQMDRSIYVVGTEFFEQILLDKKCGVLYSNPPYSQYVEWMVKIIREANARVIYFVVPCRWASNERVQEALTLREAKTECLAEFDFLDAPRQARARVEILKVNLGYDRYRNSLRVDPFDLWFEENFKLEINKSETSKFAWKESLKASTGVDQALVGGGDLVKILETCYQAKLSEMMSTYKALETVDAELLRELDVNMDSLKGALRLKIEGLKDTFWHELFSNMTKITSRLTHSVRQSMLNKLNQHIHVDFTATNAYAILIWAIKNANTYLDDQLVALVERMTEQANVVLYKSNQNTFRDENWRYCRTPNSLDRYALEYRIVLQRVGGICRSDYAFERDRYSGLSEAAFHFIGDILVIAQNIGFDTSETQPVSQFTWESNKAMVFQYYDHRRKQKAELMKVRAFKNGNLHIHFNQAFMCRLNVEFGRLKGWLKDSQHASKETGFSLEDCVHSFGSNLRLDQASAQHLLLPETV